MAAAALLLLLVPAVSAPSAFLARALPAQPPLLLRSLRPFSAPSLPPRRSRSVPAMDRGRSWLRKIGFSAPADCAAGLSAAGGPDDDAPAPGQQFAQFGAGCFWGVELAYQRVPGVTGTEAGYSQGCLHNATYEAVCGGRSGHAEVVRVRYDPTECSYDALLDVFWARHDPTTLNRQGNDVGTQYRSGIYFYTPEQEKAARESAERLQNSLGKKIVTEIFPAKKFYRAEEYHQQYLAKGGQFGANQSSEKGCTDPIRCYG